MVRRPSPVDLMLSATIVIWAFNITVTKYVLTHGFQPLAYGAIRYGAPPCSLSAVAFALEARCRRRAAQPDARSGSPRFSCSSTRSRSSTR